MPGVFIHGRHRKLSKKSAAVAAGGMAAAFVAGDIVTAAGSASAMGADDWSRLSLPFHARCHAILRARTLDEAIAVVAGTPRACAVNFLIAQAPDRIVDIDRPQPEYVQLRGRALRETVAEWKGKREMAERAGNGFIVKAKVEAGGSTFGKRQSGDGAAAGKSGSAAGWVAKTFGLRRNKE